MQRSSAMREEFGGGHDRFGAMRAGHADGVNAVGDLLGATPCDAVEASQEKVGRKKDGGKDCQPKQSLHSYSPHAFPQH